MGYDLRIYAGIVWSFESGTRVVNPDIVLELPRFGGSALPLALSRFRLSGPLIGVPVDNAGGFEDHDGYGEPLTPVDPQRLLDWLDDRPRFDRDHPSVAALRAILKKVVKGRAPKDFVVIPYGH